MNFVHGVNGIQIHWGKSVDKYPGMAATQLLGGDKHLYLSLCFQ